MSSNPVESPAQDRVIPVPGPSPEDEARRRAELRKHKTIATSLLAAATAVYILMRWLQFQGNPGAWIGYVRAASEAGMVGALADWFAVAALFRHPLHIPIPHTAIVKRKKDQVGHALKDFVDENFLNPALIGEKVQRAQIPLRAADWLVSAGGAQRCSREAGRIIEAVVGSIDAQDAELIFRTLVVDELSEPTWGPPLGRALEQLIEEGRTEPAVDAVVAWMDDKARTSEDFVVRLIDERTPSWAPRFVRELVGSRVYHELVAFTSDVRHNPEHEARTQLRKFIHQLSQDLQHDAQTISRVEKFKRDVLSSGPVEALPGTLWESASTRLTSMARDPESLLRQKVTAWALEWGRRIQQDTVLRGKLDRRVVAAAHYLAENYGPEATSIISDTVERWDAQEASDRIELMVGKDLQFIRVNGTIVGALAGLAIYTLTELVFAVA